MARWELYSADARAAILRVEDYLLLKRRQSGILLETFELLQESSAPAGIAKRRVERNRDEIQRLNRGRSRKSQQDGRTNRLYGPRTRVAYLAGVMDSDGTFKIERRRVKAMINPHYRIKIGAAQVAPSPAIELLAETFGGTIRVRNYDGPTYRSMARWSLFDKSAAPAVGALLPYLVIKAPQARLLLQLRELKARGKLGVTEWVHRTRGPSPHKMRKRCYTPKQVREFDRLFQIVKALHNDSPPYQLPKLDGTKSPPK